ncbi:MAG: YraN family protein [Candidatus Promineifilaceae bacterium]
MTNARKKLGAWGESVAATHLEANQYTICDRNWRARTREHGMSGELDIVARRGQHWAFVEVKTRRGGLPEQQITTRKAHQLMQLALVYLEAHNLSDETDFSIDLVAVELDGSGKLLRIEHIPNIVVEW